MNVFEALEQEREEVLLERLRQTMRSLQAVQGREGDDVADPIFDDIIDILTHTQDAAMPLQDGCEGEAWGQLRADIEGLYRFLHSYIDENAQNAQDEAEWRCERNSRWREHAVHNALAAAARGLKAKNRGPGRFKVAEWAAVCISYMDVANPIVRRDLRIIEIQMGTSLAEAERLVIEKTIEACEGDKSRAAMALGIQLRTLYRRLPDSV